MECKNTSIRGQRPGIGARAFARFSLRHPADFRAAFGTRKLKRRERRAPCAGFTLIELMVASSLGLVLATVIALLSFFSTRSFVAMASYTDMNQRSQLALDKMSKEIRQAHSLTAYSKKSLTFANADGVPLSFTYKPSTKQLVRVCGTSTSTLLTDCDSVDFQIYQHTMISNSFDCYNVAEVTNARMIQVNWKNSGKILGKKATTESVQSAKITIRNH